MLTRCPACEAEVLPRERFCGACGGELKNRSLAQAPLNPASRGRRALALGVDAIAVTVFAPLSLEIWTNFAAPGLFTVAYFVGLQSGGRQTLGQLVLRIVVLDSQWRTLGWRAALTRTLSLGWAGRSRLWSSPDL